MIKATSLLSILAIWIATITAVAISPDAWWIIIFAFLATGAIGISAWRRLGLARVIAIAGIWAGLAIAVGYQQDAAWACVFAFVSTGAVVYSSMRRDALMIGLAIAVPWLIVGVWVAHNGSDATWACVFAFLTAGGLANSQGDYGRGLIAIAWWVAAGVVAYITGWTWLCIFAFLLAEASFGLHAFSLPRGIEWDLFDRKGDPDDESRWVN